MHQRVALKEAPLVPDGDVEGNDGVQVGQRDLRSRHRERLHGAVHSARGAEKEMGGKKITTTTKKKLARPINEGTCRNLRGEQRLSTLLPGENWKESEGVAFPKSAATLRKTIEEVRLRRPSRCARAALSLSKISTSQPVHLLIDYPRVDVRAAHRERQPVDGNEYMGAPI